MARSKRQGAKPTIASKAINDGIVTAAFIGIAASFIELGKRLGPAVGIDSGGTTLGLTILLLIALVPVCQQLGGAVFNPANNAFLYAMGQGSAREHVARAGGQAVGGVVGALLAQALLPESWTKDLSTLALGLRPGVSLLEGAACEFVLGALLAFIVLQSGQLESNALKLWIPLIATVVAISVGAEISGPSLNPAFTFAWVFVYPLQSPKEHLFVYWLTPIAAGLFGGFAFRGYDAFRKEGQQQAKPARKQAQQEPKQQAKNGSKQKAARAKDE